ncbi:hypothetical protein FJQ54_01990 [Sandaracinobacter neustonicus]|uniref:Glycosyltransferase family 4 protein n=1 Tax=Sandaracinobacter neustonicus TaxID=1715348 RepID=A0A501XU37_9SPHN|nr:hypothetical protein [Sandaracinobacter neustonicus]TPE63654.1 hypothetical protein FJQ54_01990 [Sandaracinobacter neustonicus]
MNRFSIEIVSDIQPDPLNRGGPSGLLYEIMHDLAQIPEFCVTARHFSLPSNKLKRRMAQLLLLPERPESRPADLLLAYPSTAIRHIHPNDRSRTIVLGPDSLSLLWTRAAKQGQGVAWLRAGLLARWFSHVDRFISRSFACYLVVGKADRRWIARQSGKNARTAYLPHPLLTHSLLPAPEIEAAVAAQSRPTVLFAGAMSDMYSTGLFEELIDHLISKADLLRSTNLLLVGATYEAAYRRLAANGLSAQWQIWIDQYEELFRGHIIQPVPLAVGAGTKNRVLTALANGATIIGTSVAVENCVEKDFSYARSSATPHPEWQSRCFPPFGTRGALAHPTSPIPSRHSARAGPPIIAAHSAQ